MQVFRPVYANSSTSPLAIVAYNKEDARKRLKTFLEKNDEAWFDGEYVIDVEPYRESPEGVVVL